MNFIVLFQTKTRQPFIAHVQIHFIWKQLVGSTGSFRKRNMLNTWLFFIFPRFLLQLVSSASVLDHTPVSLNIVETNPFKHLTHLSLKFLPGNDAEIKKFLASCLKCLKVKWRLVIAATSPWCYVYLIIFFRLSTSKVCIKLYALVYFLFYLIYVIACSYLGPCHKTKLWLSL